MFINYPLLIIPSIIAIIIYTYLLLNNNKAARHTLPSLFLWNKLETKTHNTHPIEKKKKLTGILKLVSLIFLCMGILQISFVHKYSPAKLIVFVDNNPSINCIPEKNLYFDNIITEISQKTGINDLTILLYPDNLFLNKDIYEFQNGNNTQVNFFSIGYYPNCEKIEKRIRQFQNEDTQTVIITSGRDNAQIELFKLKFPNAILIKTPLKIKKNKIINNSPGIKIEFPEISNPTVKCYYLKHSPHQYQIDVNRDFTVNYLGDKDHNLIKLLNIINKSKPIFSLITPDNVKTKPHLYIFYNTQIPSLASFDKEAGYLFINPNGQIENIVFDNYKIINNKKFATIVPQHSIFNSFFPQNIVFNKIKTFSFDKKLADFNNFTILAEADFIPIILELNFDKITLPAYCILADLRPEQKFTNLEIEPSGSFPILITNIIDHLFFKNNPFYGKEIFAGDYIKLPFNPISIQYSNITTPQTPIKSELTNRIFHPAKEGIYKFTSISNREFFVTVNTKISSNFIFSPTQTKNTLISKKYPSPIFYKTKNLSGLLFLLTLITLGLSFLLDIKYTHIE